MKTIFAFRPIPNQNIIKKVTNNAMKKSSKPATIGTMGIINLGKYTLVIIVALVIKLESDLTTEVEK